MYVRCVPNLVVYFCPTNSLNVCRSAISHLAAMSVSRAFFVSTSISLTGSMGTGTGLFGLPVLSRACSLYSENMSNIPAGILPISFGHFMTC